MQFFVRIPKPQAIIELKKIRSTSVSHIDFYDPSALSRKRGTKGTAYADVFADDERRAALHIQLTGCAAQKYLQPASSSL
jgi:hypothetical protein